MIDDISGLLAYKKRVARDLTGWENEGWVTPQNADHIRKSLEKSDSSSRMPLVFTFLGAILLGFAALSFMAANWAEMSKLAKVALLFTTMGSAYGAAIYFHIKKKPNYANIATLLGLLLFGVNIALVSQIYHISGNVSDGLFLWSLGALSTALLTNSRSALILAIIGGASWSVTIGWTDDYSFHWPYLIFWGVCVAWAQKEQWREAFHLSALSLISFAFSSAITLDSLGWETEEIFPFFGLIAASIWFLAQRTRGLLQLFSTYALLSSLICLFFVQLFGLEEFAPTTATPYIIAALLFSIMAIAYNRFIREGSNRDAVGGTLLLLALILPTSLITAALAPSDAWFLILESPLVFLIALWLIYAGSTHATRSVTNIGFTLFAAQTIYIYLETLGTLIGSASFFFVSGILLIAGGWALNKWRLSIVQLGDGMPPTKSSDTDTKSEEEGATS